MSWLRAADTGRYGPSDSVGNHDGWFVRLLGGGKTKAGTIVSEYSAMTLPVVYSAVSIIADAVAQPPLNVMRKRKRRGKVGVSRDVADDIALYDVLHDSPNEFMTSFTWRNTTQHHISLWGNGYSEIELNRKGEAVGIWPLLPDRTRAEKDSSGNLRYRTNIDGKSYALDYDRVLHVPALGFDGYTGYSPLHMARQAVGMGLALEEFGAKFFSNDAKSGGFLMHPGRLSAGARENLRAAKGKGEAGQKKRTDPGADLQTQGGLDNAHRVKVLEEGMKFVATTIPPEDAQFLGTREFQIAEIARIFRVPLVMLSSHEKTTSWGSGIEQLMIGFVVWTVSPWIKRWEEELNRKLFTKAQKDAGYYVKFNLNSLLRGDMATRSRFYESAIRATWMVPNEARELEEMNPREGGDEPVLNMKAAPQGADNQDQTQKDTQQ